MEKEWAKWHGREEGVELARRERERSEMGKVRLLTCAPPFLDLPRPFCGAPSLVRHKNETFCGAPSTVRHRNTEFCGARRKVRHRMLNFCGAREECATELCISVAQPAGCATEYGQIFPTWSTDVGPTFFLWRTKHGAPQKVTFL